MDFQWDEKKRLLTLQKRGIDFRDASLLFSGPIAEGAAYDKDGEQRYMAIGLLHGVEISVIYTKRGDVTRIITMRRSRPDERQRYQDLFGG